MKIEETGKALFGIPENPPQLPEGFEFVSDPDSFLMAKSPSGEPFYVFSDGLRRAVPVIEWQWTGKFYLGEKYEP